METLDRHLVVQLFAELIVAINGLVDDIKEHCDGVVVYQLPVVNEGSVVSSHFPVEKLGTPDTVDPQALELAVTALRRFSLCAAQKRTTTYRLPGFISVTKNLSEQIVSINSLKDRLQTHFMETYPKTVSRSRACKQIFPGVHMNQVYRHVFPIPDEMRRVNFTWQCQSPADVWITPDIAIEMAQTALEEEAHKATRDSSKLMALQLSLEYFQSLPKYVELTKADLDGIDPRKVPYQLLRRNYVRPHPRAQLFGQTVNAPALLTHAANLPLIRMPSSDPLSIRDLKDYCAGKSRKRSDTKSGFEELSHALHILGGYPTVDMYLRRLSLQEKARNRVM